MKYYYSLDNKPSGPIPLEDLHQLYRNGVITLATLVVPEGGTEWKAYASLNPPPKDAAPPVAATPPAPMPPPEQPAAAAPSIPAPPSFAATPVRSGTTSTSPPPYRNLALISYILLAVTALISVIPVLGCFSWVMLIPVCLGTIALGIVILTRGGQRDGIIILVASIVVLPVFTIVAPIVTTAIFGKLTGLDKQDKKTNTPVVTTPAIPAPPMTAATPAAVAPTLARTVEQDPDVLFQKLDVSQNGYLSGTEMKDYEGYDANKDKRVTKEELAAGGARDTRLKAITATLDQFLLMLNRGQYNESFDAGAPSFREGLTKAAYTENLRKIRSPFGKATDHQLKTIDTNTDVATGQKTYVIPVASTFENGTATETITVVQDTDKQYRVSDYSLTIENSSAPPTLPGEAGRGVPNEVLAKQLVNNTMVNFKNAVNSGDFGPFYRTQLSALWKKQTTAEKLKGYFQTFIDRKVDLSPIFMVQPVLDPAPAINSDGLLILKGYYPLPAQKINVTYQLSYSREAKWGLSGINVKIDPIAE